MMNDTAFYVAAALKVYIKCQQIQLAGKYDANKGIEYYEKLVKKVDEWFSGK